MKLFFSTLFGQNFWGLKAWFFAIGMIFFYTHSAHAQSLGIGASGLYNFQSEGYGAGVRVSINPNNRLSIVPQASYYFPSNKVHEFTLGLSAEYKLLMLNNFQFYGLVHGAYNAWLNYTSSPMEGAQLSNWNLELGGGISTLGCWRPFLAYRYNLNFKETHLQLGILYVLGCRGGRNKGICPAYH